MELRENFMPSWKQTKKQMSHKVPQLTRIRAGMRNFYSEGLLPTFRGRKHRFSFDLTANAYDGAPLSCNFHIFFTACTLQNSHVEALAHGKIKSGRKSLVKKKKWKRNLDQRRKKERVPFCQEKKKISSWQRPVLAELCAGVQVSNIVKRRRQTEICHT